VLPKPPLHLKDLVREIDGPLGASVAPLPAGMPAWRPPRNPASRLCTDDPRDSSQGKRVATPRSRRSATDAAW
jgi:hypothetical protein